MRRNLKSKKISELIDDFLKIKKTEKKPAIVNFFNIWKEVVGKQVASETKNIRINNKVLYITIKNPYLKTDLSFQKTKILEKIKLLNSNVDKIIFD